MHEIVYLLVSWHEQLIVFNEKQVRVKRNISKPEGAIPRCQHLAVNQKVKTYADRNPTYSKFRLLDKIINALGFTKAAVPFRGENLIFKTITELSSQRFIVFLRHVNPWRNGVPTDFHPLSVELDYFRSRYSLASVELRVTKASSDKRNGLENLLLLGTSKAQEESKKPCSMTLAQALPFCYLWTFVHQIPPY